MKYRGGDRRVVNGSRIEFFLRINLCPKIKTPGNLYARRWLKHLTTVETWSQKNYKANRRRMGSIRLTISKLCLKQWSRVAAGKVQWTFPVHPEYFLKFKSFFPTLIHELWGTKLDETWTQGSPQHKEYISKRGFSQIQRFPFRF
jgi:hypothetical protein